MRTDTYEVSPFAKTFSRASAGKSLRPLWKASTPEYSGSEIRFSLYLSGSLGCSSGCQLGISRGCRETGSLGQQRVGSPQEEQQRRTRLQRLQLRTHGKAEREQVIAAKLATHLRYECFSTSITCSIGSWQDAALLSAVPLLGRPDEGCTEISSCNWSIEVLQNKSQRAPLLWQKMPVRGCATERTTH